MALRLALVIDGDQSGAKRAMDETVSGITKVDEAAGKAGASAQKLPEALGETATKTTEAKTAMEDLGGAAEGAGGKFSNFKTLAIGAVGGIAGALAGAALEWAADAAIGAVTDYFDEVTNSATNIKGDLEAHKALIGSVKGLWDEAAGAASTYGANSKPLLMFEASQNIERLSGDLGSETGKLNNLDFVRNPYILPTALSSNTGADHPLRSTMVALKADLEDGLADVIGWRDKILAIANETELGSDSRRVAQEFVDNTTKAVELQAELNRAVDIVKALNGDGEAGAAALGSVAKNMDATGDSAATALPALREYQALIRSLSGASTPSFTKVAGTGFSGAGPKGEFAGGGPTGDDVPIDQIAGVTHGQEFVVRAGPASEYRSLLEMINGGGKPPGYAAGGFVGNARTPSISGGFSSGASSNSMAWLLGGFTDLPDLVEAARGPVVSFFSDVFRAQQTGQGGWDGWLQKGANALDTISSKAADMALNGIFDLLAGAITGGLGGNFIGGTFGAPALRLGFQAGVGHSGAIIGSSPSSRLVDASVFDNAPRHHSGTPALRQGEVPFIGMEGEEVGWPDDLARKYGGGFTFAPTNHISMPAGAARADVEAMLDERDSLLKEQFADMVRDVLDHPRR